MNATQPEPATIESLADSPRLPVVFVGHGSPMNAIEDNAYRRSWQDLGSKFGVTWPRPQLILCVSAHWLTQGWWLTAMDAPRTIHDFGGFPPELFAQTYPAPGQPAAARELSQRLRQPGSGNALGLDVDAWGLDHGAWSVLKPMFPAADIPVLQLSMDYRRPPAEHLALGGVLGGDLQRAAGATVIMVSSDLDRMLTVTDRVGMLYRGKLIFDGTTAEAKASRDPFVRQFVDGEPDGPVRFHYPAKSLAEDFA